MKPSSSTSRLDPALGFLVAAGLLELLLVRTRGLGLGANGPKWAGLFALAATLALVGTCVVVTRARTLAPRREWLLGTILVGTLLPLVAPPLEYTPSGVHDEALIYLALAALGGFAMRVAGGPGQRTWWTVMFLALVAERAATLLAPVAPFIDVWHFQQVASQALLAGTDPYVAVYPDLYKGDGFGYVPFFPYLPVSFLATTPFYAVLHDVRWLHAAAEVASAGLLHRFVARRTGDVDAGRIASIALLTAAPSLFVIEHAWIEPLLVLLLVGSALALEAERYVLAGVLVGAALATKQTVLLALPVIVLGTEGWRARSTLAASALAAAVSFCLPFFLWDPGAFIGSVSKHLSIPARPDAYSVRMLVEQLGGVRLPVAIAWVLLGLSICSWRRRRGGGPVLTLIGASSILFFSFERQAFFNYYYLGGLLVIAGLLLEGASVARATTAPAAPAAGVTAEEAP